jgi:hypothetical protein
MLRHLPTALTLAMLMGVLLQARARNDPESVAAYHARVREAVRAIPYRVGPWEGVDRAPPSAAVRLLRPNVLFSRQYTDPQRRRSGTLVIVQCTDSRDMGGHYPPVCYPAHGWRTTVPGTLESVQVGGMPVRVARYTFDRSSFNTRRALAVYGFFVLPGSGLGTDLGAVRRAAADYRVRALGAAQVQVVLDEDLTPAEEVEVVGELLAAAWPAVEEIARGQSEEQP